MYTSKGIKNWSWLFFTVAATLFSVATFLPFEVWSGGDSLRSSSSHAAPAFSHNMYDAMGYDPVPVLAYLSVFLPVLILIVFGYFNANSNILAIKIIGFILSALGNIYFFGYMLLMCAVMHVNDHLGVSNGVGFYMAVIMLLVMHVSWIAALVETIIKRKRHNLK